jgi:hypothetical protein
VKLEEIISLLRAGKKIEFLTTDRNGYKTWREVDTNPHHVIDYYGSILEKSLKELMETAFRIKKEKIKRYQVIYSSIGCPDECYITPPKSQKYKDRKDFNRWMYNSDKVFRTIVLESEEEFEEEVY